jgi:tRNA(adenine34) deaminase
MADDRYWMSLALEEAREAFREGEVPVGCVVVHGNEVVGRGRNRVEESGDPFAHAELIALKDSLNSIHRNSMRECAVYVTVEPCLMCFGSLIAARIPKVVYGVKEPKTGVCESVLSLPADPALRPRIIAFGGVEEAACKELMQTFFRMHREDQS